jgi:hypothetical protein
MDERGPPRPRPSRCVSPYFAQPISPCEQLEITDHYSGGELDGALAAARQARSYRAARELAPGRRAAGSGALPSRRDFAQPALGAEGFPPDLDDRLTSTPAVRSAQGADIDVIPTCRSARGPNADLRRKNGMPSQMLKRDCHIAVRRARSVGASGIVRLLRLRSAMRSSPQREARGAFGLK